MPLDEEVRMPEEESDAAATQKLVVNKPLSLDDEQEVQVLQRVTPTSEQRTGVFQLVTQVSTVVEVALPRSIKQRDLEAARFLRERCQQFCLSLFFREVAPVRSLGFTSAIGGEGKSFLAMVTAGVLASDSQSPVSLLECNWEHPSVHEYYGFSATPGLAEWVRGECSEADIRHRVGHNLTVIPAGQGKQDAVKLLQRIRRDGLLQMFARIDDLMI